MAELNHTYTPQGGTEKSGLAVYSLFVGPILNLDGAECVLQSSGHLVEGVLVPVGDAHFSSCFC